MASGELRGDLTTHTRDLRDCRLRVPSSGACRARPPLDERLVPSLEPADVIFFMRYRRGTWAVLSVLRAECNWHRIMREILFEDEPSTDIGIAWARAEVPHR